MNDDNVLRMPRTLREDKEALPVHDPATINVAQKTQEGVTSDFLHRLFNHSNPEKVHQTLGVTSGIKQPDCQMKGCYCTSCAQANARRRGLKHTQFSMMAALSTDMPGLCQQPDDFGPAEDESDGYEDHGYDSMPELKTETFSDMSDSGSDASSDSESEDEAIIATVGEAQNSDSEDYDETEPDSVDSKPSGPPCRGVRDK